VGSGFRGAGLRRHSGAIGWREWESRHVELRNAEVDMANLAQSLSQHAEDTFELADTILAGMVDRMEVGGTSPAAVAKIQASCKPASTTGSASAASSSTTKPAAGSPRPKMSTSRASTTATATTFSAIAPRPIAGP